MKRLTTFLMVIVLILTSFSVVASEGVEYEPSVIPESLKDNNVSSETWTNVISVITFAFAGNHYFTQQITPQAALSDFVLDPYCSIIFRDCCEHAELYYDYDNPIYDPKKIHTKHFGFYMYDSKSIDDILAALYGFSAREINKLHDENAVYTFTNYEDVSFYYTDEFYYAGALDGFGGPYNWVENYKILKDFGKGKLYLQFNISTYDDESFSLYVILEPNKKNDMPFCTIRYLSTEEYDISKDSSNISSPLVKAPVSLFGWLINLFNLIKEMF